jgi:RimJ/RimL family protein N-acetyltransferase
MTSHVLKREIVDVGDDVRAAGPPVVPTFATPYALRPVDPDSADPDTIARWMSLPHLVESWEQPWTREEWRADSAARLAGDYSRPCILGVDVSKFDGFDPSSLGIDDAEGMIEVAYVELYRAARDENATVYDAGPHDMGFHIATGPTEFLDRGIISAWMAQLADAIFAAEPRCDTIIVDPDHRNTRMRRALQKRGYTELGEFDVRPGRRIALHTMKRS